MYLLYYLPNEVFARRSRWDGFEGEFDYHGMIYTRLYCPPKLFHTLCVSTCTGVDVMLVVIDTFMYICMFLQHFVAGPFISPDITSWLHILLNDREQCACLAILDMHKPDIRFVHVHSKNPFPFTYILAKALTAPHFWFIAIPSRYLFVKIIVIVIVRSVDVPVQL